MLLIQTLDLAMLLYNKVWIIWVVDLNKPPPSLPVPYDFDLFSPPNCNIDKDVNRFNPLPSAYPPQKSTALSPK